MSNEVFFQFADLIANATLLVAGDGSVLAANRRAREFLCLSPTDSRSLNELVSNESAELRRYLRQCARSRECVITALHFRVGDQITKFRSEGAQLSPRTDGEPARIMLQLFAQDVSTEPFVALKDKISELAQEIERRKQSELLVLQHLRLSEFGRSFGLALSKTGTLDEILSRCTDLMVEYLDVVFARIWIADPQRQLLILRASSGMYTHLDGDHSQVPIGALKIGWIAEQQLPHLTNEVVGDPRINDQDWARREGMVAFAGYPLIVDGVTIGVMAVFSRKTLSETVLSAMSTVANELAIGISRKQNEDALREKASALEVADARKNEFLAMLAHELRNPLAPIRSGLELLISNDSSSEILEVMQRQVDHMVRIVEDLLDVSRIMRGHIEMRKERVSLKNIVDRSIESVRPSIHAAKHKLEVCEIPDTYWLDGDEVRLTQVLNNLLHNAAKYTPDGGEISLTATRVDEQVVLSIRDNGIGIEPGFVPHMFSLFAQATRSLDRSQGGLGIGLTLVERIVSMHGGSVTVTSEGSGQGSEFQVSLPLIDAPAHFAASDSASCHSSITALPKYRILIVDDNAASAKILARLLAKNWNHEILLAHEGQAACDIALAQPPDIIFLDIGLPVMNGYEVAAVIRAQATCRQTMIVALTGYGTDDDRRRSREAGIDVHLVKPVGIDDLSNVFRAKHESLESFTDT